jgi:hypothetical protein
MLGGVVDDVLLGWQLMDVNRGQQDRMSRTACFANDFAHRVSGKIYRSR